MENQKELRIFGTFGPTCHTREDIGNMLDAGMNGIRLNLSHSSIREHEDWMEEWKAACENTHHDCELILDLQGRERRLSGDFEPIELEEGDLISIPAQLPLGGDVLLFLETGDQLLLGDDDVPLHVEEKSGDGFVAKAMSKGRIHPGMNIHILGKDSDLPIVCARDLESLERGKQIGATGVMVPFVQNASDLRQIRKVVEPLIENCASTPKSKRWKAYTIFMKSWKKPMRLSSPAGIWPLPVRWKICRPFRRYWKKHAKREANPT